jgi:hypothetical protein
VTLSGAPAVTVSAGGDADVVAAEALRSGKRSVHAVKRCRVVFEFLDKVVFGGLQPALL